MGDDLSRALARRALVVAAATAVAATVAAGLHAPPAALGWLAAVACLAVALAAAASARALNAPDDLQEPRIPHGPSHAAPLPKDIVTRRDASATLWGWTAGAFALLGIVPFVALARKPVPSGTAWTAGARLVTHAGRPLRPDDLAIGGIETVFPDGHVDAPQAATLLLRLADDAPKLAPERRDWVQHGNIAYSKICTHAGCPVAIYRKQSLELYCPCHQSVFDVADGARPVAGPATRALPQLGLATDAAGYLIARGDFVEPVGPDTWWRG